ncbi:MAG: (2Fe-2S)-binding protein [Dehalobacterium sp.]|jgi:carbon-monoxide dehydrogenase small subunit
MKIDVKINGKNMPMEVAADEFLSDALRRYGYLSIRRGCDTSSCGLCTVWLEEKPVLSCSVPAPRADGKNVTTIEGVEEKAREFAEFLVKEGGEQCGYCSPGLIMTVLAMKKELKKPGEDEIRHYLNGNLCRCSGYQSQMRAIKKYLGVDDYESDK